MYIIDESGKMVEILRAEELSHNVYTSVKYYQEKAAAANEKAKMTIEEAKKQVLNSYEDENARLKERLRLSWGEFASEKELQAYNDFVQEHMHERATKKIQSGEQPYIIPHYTGIGCAKEAVCPICGEKKNITDYDVW